MQVEMRADALGMLLRHPRSAARLYGMPRPLKAYWDEMSEQIVEIWPEPAPDYAEVWDDDVPEAIIKRPQSWA